MTKTKNLGSEAADKQLSPKKEKRKMRPGGGKSKGNGFENVVAKKLTAALDPLKFIRTQGSGARVGGKNFETIGQMFGEDALKLFVGDVVPVNEVAMKKRFHYSVECKFYKTPDGFTSLVAGNANIFKWMQEAIDDANKVGKTPLLIFKWNNTPIFVAGLRENMAAWVPNLSLTQNKRTIDIFYLDEMLNEKDFWFSDTE